MIRDKANRLKLRADKIIEYKNRQELERQKSREQRELLERHLEPVVNTERS